MTWLSTSRTKICFALGMPHTSENYNLLQVRMDALNTLNAAAVTTVEAFLIELDQLEAEIEAARDGTPADVIPILQAECRRYAKRVAIALNLEVQNNVFS